ncbi:MAG: glycogen synthase GlgA [Rhodobacteraceae bacterium]|nr:glycogen synthase GlgA [Paracoccaceae bacterium]
MAGREVKVLSVTSECVPFIKTGGLADVAGALPGALAAEGVEMRTLLPGYPAVMEFMKDAEKVYELKELYGAAAWLLSAKVEGIELLVLDAPHLFARPGNIYLSSHNRDWADNAERFAALCQVACDIAGGALDGWTPDVVHAHDWQGGMAPYYIARSGAQAKTVLTIHNIAFQGIAPAIRAVALDIAAEDFHADGVEYWGQVSALKAGLNYADRLTTVSPTYAEELMRPEFGMGMDGVLRRRRNDLQGILNGIDTTVWSPEDDPMVQNYKSPRGKAKNKEGLRQEFDLPETDGPLCVVITRMTEQKGLDLLLEALPALIGAGGQLALLGSGSAELEQAFLATAADEPNVAVKIGYDEALSHRMVAGGDAILVPSRFEPCGLTQMMGLRYGTVPVVALTGGLADTVIPATPATMPKGLATGIQFAPVTASALTGALTKLTTLYADQKAWAKIQRNAMAHPVGWDSSAKEYAALYQSLVDAS